MIVGAAVVVAGPPAAPALAADGDARPELTDKNVIPPAAVGGDTIQYSINYTCSNSFNEPPVDGCDGAVFTDPIPTFTNIYGQEMPLEFVSVTTTDVFPDLHLDATDPANPLITGVAATWTPGTSGTVFVTLRVPPGMVPAGPAQIVTNVATVTDPVAPADDSTEAQTSISAGAPQWTISKLGPASPTRMNREQSWTVSVCGAPGAALWPTYEITDTLPPGVVFEGTDHGGVYTDDPDAASPDTTSDGAGTVTWTFGAANRPPLGTDGCFRLHVTGRFPSGYVDPSTDDPANDDNVGGAVKINTVTGTGRDATTSQGLGTDDWPLELLDPDYFGTGIDKELTDLAGADDHYVQDGDTARFNLAIALDSDLPVDQVVLTDGSWEFTDGVTSDSGTGLPESFTATQLDPGTWNGGLTATILGSNDDFATPGTPIVTDIASDAPVIDLTPTFRSFRWVWGGTAGSVPADFAAGGIQISGTFGAPGATTFGNYTNIARVETTFNGAVDSHTSSDDYILETPLPLPSISKTVDDGLRRPGQTATYTVRVVNDPDATGPLTNPVMQDCLPEFLLLQGAPTAAGWTSGPLPSCGPGETAIGFTFDGTLERGEVAPDITFTIMVAPSDPGPIAPYGLYTNTAFVRPSGGGEFGHCVQSDPLVCGSSADLTVPPTVALESQKCVTGDLDGGVFRPSPSCTTGEPSIVSGQTLPGGGMTWRLQLRNVGNTAATNVEFIDIFPRRDDTAIISTTDGVLNQRHSEWDPILVSLISAQPGWTVSYSTSTNPCRGEVGGPTTGCENPNWTTTPDLAALASYRSIRLSFDDTLPIGGTATFEWDMRAPVLDTENYDKLGTDPDNPYEFLETCVSETPSSDPDHCPRAVNSFAYGADAAGLPVGVPQPSRLFAEPPQVDVRVVGPPRTNAIGDRVWFDRNFDGLQGDPAANAEPGIPGVRVELWQPGGTEPVDVTYTDANGNYLFQGDTLPLADGDYVVRIHPPEGYYVSPQDQSGPAGDAGAPGAGVNPGANTDDDSDVDPTGLTGGPIPGTYYETPVVQLGDNDNTDVGGPTQGETDPTWDAGLWRAIPAVDITKVTKDSAWDDSAAGDGVVIVHGRPVTWIYTITNTGNSRLEDVTITDDGGPGATFGVSDCTITADGTNADGLLSTAAAPIALNRGATMRCTATGTAGTANYANNGTIVGTPVTDGGEEIPGVPPGFPPLPPTVTDTDPSTYVAGIYDLALAKTAGAVNYATGNVTFTITVRNQGTFASGDYTVTDLFPDGMTVVSTTPAAASTVAQPDGTTLLTWNRSGLAPSTNHTFTINAHIDDYLAKPFRNIAEISADGSAQVVTGNGVATPTSDIDSTPSVFADDGAVYGPVGTPNPAGDNANIGEASTDPQGGQDDADIADVNPAIVYDLALAKVAVATPVALGDAPVYTLRVYNQGNVPSGPVSVLDQIPTGLTFASAGSSAGCADAVPAAPNLVECDIAGIAPGGFVDLTLATTIDQNGGIVDYGSAPWRNWAEIGDDSANELYGADVNDSDSDPESESTDGIGADGTLPGDAYAPVTTAGPTYGGPASGDEDDNDDADIAAPAYDLALIKTAAATDATPDAPGTITYTITVVNQGDVPSGAYTVTDTLPAGVSPTVLPAGATAAGSIVTWSGTNLAPAASAVFTLTVQIDDVNRRPFRNLAEISADSAAALYGLTDVDSIPNGDPTDDNDGNGVPDGDGYGPIGAPVNDNLEPEDAGTGDDVEDDADIADVDFPLSEYGYDLALVKVAEAAEITYDGTITYTITVQNQGVLDSHEFTVTDVVPPGLAVADLGGAVDNGDGTITWTVANLEPAQSVELTFTAEIADITLRPFRNVAEIAADSADDYTVGDDVVTDRDSTPGDPEDSDLDNTDISEAGDGDDDGFDDEDIAVVDVVEVRYDLALIKTGPATMDPTGDVTFTITVANQGNVPSGEYEVTDTVPAGMVAVAASAGGDVATDPAVVTWALPSIEPGATQELTVTVRVTDLGLRPFTNVAEITADSGDGYSTPTETVSDDDSTPGDDETSLADNTTLDEAGVGPVEEGGDDGFDDEDVATVSTDVVYDLELAKTVSPAAIAPDGSATFTITVFNHGNVPSGPVTVTDTLPTGLAAGAISDGGTLASDLTTVTWQLADLAVGATKDLTVSVTVTDFGLRPFRNVAEITADSAAQYSIDGDEVTDIDSTPADPESNDADNESIGGAGIGDDDGFDDEDPAVLAGDVRYDLALVKTVVPGQSYAVGSPIAFSIVVANQGNVASGAYSVHDALPAGLSFVSASDGGVANAGVVTWTDQPSLAAGATATLTVTARLDDPNLTAYVNTAEITADGSAAYDTPSDDVHDVDSTVDGDLGNDPLVDADDVNVARPGDEDDHDIAALDVGAIQQANPPAAPPSTPAPTTPPAPPSVPGELPRTGGSSTPLVLLAAAILAAGLVLTLVRRRSRGAR